MANGQKPGSREREALKKAVLKMAEEGLKHCRRTGMTAISYGVPEMEAIIDVLSTPPAGPTQAPQAQEGIVQIAESELKRLRGIEKFMAEEVPLGCTRKPWSSRTCQRGTKCCTENHAPQGVTPAGEPQKEREDTNG